MLAVIPFGGFYESLHSSAIDRALESLIRDESGDPFPGLVDHAWTACNHKGVEIAYCREYAAAMAREMKVKWKFESMTSPREYNFTTDRIFVTLSQKEARRIVSLVPREDLEKAAREAFTSRDGFASFYSPVVATWGPVEKWDHNQLGVAVACLWEIEGEKDHGLEELHLMEHAEGNGYLENWICTASGAELERVLKIADYLRRREERAVTA